MWQCVSQLPGGSLNEGSRGSGCGGGIVGTDVMRRIGPHHKFAESQETRQGRNEANGLFLSIDEYTAYIAIALVSEPPCVSTFWASMPSWPSRNAAASNWRRHISICLRQRSVTGSASWRRILG